MAVDFEGRPLNVNADLAAGAVASHLKAAKLLLMTDVAGVKDTSGHVLASLDRAQAGRLIADKVAEDAA